MTRTARKPHRANRDVRRQARADYEIQSALDRAERIEAAHAVPIAKAEAEAHEINNAPVLWFANRVARRTPPKDSKRHLPDSGRRNRAMRLVQQARP